MLPGRGDRRFPRRPVRVGARDGRLGELAERVQDPASDAIRSFARFSYGPAGAEQWDGAALAKALRNLSARRESSEIEATDGLPPLMPSR